jgi:hypothetical protein
MSKPFSGWRILSPISFVVLRSRAAVHALLAATRIEERGERSPVHAREGDEFAVWVGYRGRELAWAQSPQCSLEKLPTPPRSLIRQSPARERTDGDPPRIACPRRRARNKGRRERDLSSCRGSQLRFRRPRSRQCIPPTRTQRPSLRPPRPSEIIGLNIQSRR